MSCTVEETDQVKPSARHVHFHCYVIDEVFASGDGGAVYLADSGALAPEDFAAVQQQMRMRVLQ